VNRWETVWRVALLAALIWIGLELRWTRETAGMSWAFENSVSDIARSLSRINDKMGSR
jgi:hypothetical protein